MTLSGPVYLPLPDATCPDASTQSPGKEPRHQLGETPGPARSAGSFGRTRCALRVRHSRKGNQEARLLHHSRLPYGRAAVTRLVKERGRFSAQLGAVLAVVADFEAALVRGRTVEGMRIARVKGRLKGRSPKLSPAREEHVVQLYAAGEYTTSEIGELLNISRSTVYRTVKRAAKAKLAQTS